MAAFHNTRGALVHLFNRSPAVRQKVVSQAVTTVTSRCGILGVAAVEVVRSALVTVRAEACVGVRLQVADEAPCGECVGHEGCAAVVRLQSPIGNASLAAHIGAVPVCIGELSHLRVA